MKQGILIFFIFLSAWFRAQVYPFMNDKGRWGFADMQGKWVIKPRFAEVWPFFSSGKALVAKYIKNKGRDGEIRYGLIDRQGKAQSEFVYKNIDERMTIRGWYQAGKINDRGGFLDSSGNEVIPFRYLGFSQQGMPDPFFSEGFARGKNYDSWSEVFVDSSGKEIKFENKYYDLGRFSEGLAAVCVKGGYNSNALIAFVNREGKEVIPAKYYGSIFTRFSEGLCNVYDENGKTGFINKNGKVVIPFTDYTYGYEFHEGRANIFIRGKGTGVIDSAGKIITLPEYEEITPFKNGIALAHKKANGYNNGKLVHVIDRSGKVLNEIPCQALSFHFFKEQGYIAIKQNGKWGLTDLKGKTLTGFDNDYYYSDVYIYAYPTPQPTEFISVSIMRKEYSSPDSTGCIDAKTFKEIVPCKYREIFWDGKVFFVTSPRGQMGLLDRNGKVLVPCVFDKIHHFVNGLAIAEQESSNLPGFKWTGYSTEDKTKYEFNQKSFVIDLSGNVYEYSKNKMNKIFMQPDDN